MNDLIDYIPTNWENGVENEVTGEIEGTTPISRANLEKMETAIINLIEKINPIIGGTTDTSTAIYDNVFPIGRGFIDFTDADYSDYLGFKWQRTLIGMTPIGIDKNDTDFNVIGKKGGEKTHKLTKEETPFKSSVDEANGYGLTNNNPGFSGRAVVDGNVVTAFNVMQPYEIVAYWKRIV